MNFYFKFLELCNSVGKSPSKVALEIGTTKPAVTRWKSGSVPSDAVLLKIADYFGVSVEYLRGETDQKKKPLVNADEELTEYLEELKNRNEMRMLFSVTKDCTKEEVEQAVRIIEALRKKDD